MVAAEADVFRVVRAVAAQWRPIILLDGGSGAGKSQLAAAVADRIGAQLVSLDDMYPGWGGLEEASVAVHTDVLGRGTWRRWVWSESRFTETVPVQQSRPLVIEGCGALSHANRALATLGVWLDVDAAIRKRRALERDGDSYRPHWDHWAAQEAAFFERERPDRLADLILAG